MTGRSPHVTAAQPDHIEFEAVTVAAGKSLPARSSKGPAMTWQHMNTGGWMLMSGFWVVIIAIVAALILRSLAGRSPVILDATDRAHRILADRFARGEIGVEEYHERLDALDH
jgi:putative membrane protein